MIIKRNRVTQNISLEERLDLRAQMLRNDAGRTPPGPARERLLRLALQADTSSQMSLWLRSPGLASTDMIGRDYVLNRAAKLGGFRKRWSGKTDRAINAALGHFLARQVVKQREKDRQLRARGLSQ